MFGFREANKIGYSYLRKATV